MQSSKLLRRLDKPDVFHMEMSECLRDLLGMKMSSAVQSVNSCFVEPWVCICMNSAVTLQLPTCYIKLNGATGSSFKLGWV